MAKVVDMLKHIWIPVLILALNGTAGGLRTTRANLLDELNKPYVETARSKGITEAKVIWKYPVRVALNPFFSTVGWELANLISGATAALDRARLETTGPMLLRALNLARYVPGRQLPAPAEHPHRGRHAAFGYCPGVG